MLLCCFREPKSPKRLENGSSKKKKNRGHYEANLVSNGGGGEKQPLTSAISKNSLRNGSVEAVQHEASSTSRPLKTTSLHYSPVSTSSNGGEAEVLVAQVTYHSRPGRQHSMTSSESASMVFPRPPSRDGSDRRDKFLERAPMGKEAKRLMKQRSQESFKEKSFPYIDASPGAGGQQPLQPLATSNHVNAYYDSPPTSTETSPVRKGKLILQKYLSYMSM